MICFCELSHYAQMVLIVFTWLGVMAQIVLPIYRSFHHRAVIHSICDGTLLLSLLLLLCFLVRYNQDIPYYRFHIPVFILFIMLILVFAYSGISFFCEVRRSRKEINEWSVKESVDDLPVGLMFADTSGHIVLFNRKMEVLSHMLIGKHPQTLDTVMNALDNISLESGVEAITDVVDCFRFPDGRVYRFRYSKLDCEALIGYVQLSAHDETEIYEGNIRLMENNEKLKSINLRLQKIYANMEDEVKEKESLNLKVWLHDTLGSSLLTIQDVKNSSSTETKQKLKALKEAVGMLSASRSTAKGTFEEAQQKAKQLGVKVTLYGYIQPDTTSEQLITAAVRECVTNCIRHAKGNEVFVNITEQVGILRVIITNNGEAPKGKIIEGSGLSSLRRSVEASGGDMQISYNPIFSLILYLPRKEEDSL